MKDEPDFLGLARAWVAQDARLQDVRRDDPDLTERLMTRMAEALERRRRQVAQSSADEVGLVVELHRSRLDPQGRPEGQAVRQLADLVTERAEQEGEDLA